MVFVTFSLCVSYRLQLFVIAVLLLSYCYVKQITCSRLIVLVLYCLLIC